MGEAVWRKGRWPISAPPEVPFSELVDWRAGACEVFHPATSSVLRNGSWTPQVGLEYADDVVVNKVGKAFDGEVGEGGYVCEEHFVAETIPFLVVLWLCVFRLSGSGRVGAVG